MADHKAPTQVTVVTEEKSALAQFVDDNWKMAGIGALVVSVGILGFQYSQIQGRQGSMDLWDKLSGTTEINPATGQLDGDIEDVKSVAAELAGTAVEPFALAAQIQVAIGQRDYDTANAGITALRKTSYKPVSEDLFKFGEGEAEGTLADRMATLVAAQQSWEAKYSGLFENAALPDGSTRVEIETTAGKFVVGLYAEEAPKHVENFLKHVDEDFYVGTRFHRVIKGFMVQGGDPNTKTDENIEEWGQGGPGFKIDAEKNDLSHFEGFLSAAKQPGESQSSGSQFFLTTGDAHWLDGQHVVYGKILEGLDIVKEIENGEIDPEDTQGSRPLEPVEVLSVKKL
ncbi:MAG: peptidyl-prolyl cis-trans isomerase B (cyclophilin B) [Planctomycetota bacterium]|jgi:peptidyl-prolyl cis-trans isomerase B (cyclophilin B)